jgi:hypothetical protein
VSPKRKSGTRFHDQLALPARRIETAVVESDGQPRIAIRIQIPKLMKLWTQVVLTPEQARRLKNKLRRRLRQAENQEASDGEEKGGGEESGSEAESVPEKAGGSAAAR